MQHQFQPEENQTPQTAYLPVAQTSLTTETETETRDVQKITERLNEITTSAKRAKRRFWTGYIIGSACFVSAPAMIFFALLRLDFPILPFMFSLYAVGIAIMILTFFNLSRQAPKFDADELTRLGGVQAIPALVATLNTPFFIKRKQAIYAALTFLLPQMKASDAPLLTPPLRRTLLAFLANAPMGGLPHARYDAFFVAILKALEQVGDSSAIPMVSRLAKMKGQTRRRKLLREAAIECLPMLRANCGEVETSRTLLRASQSEPTDPATLLRPASGSAPTAAAELLRGSDSPDAADSDRSG